MREAWESQAACRGSDPRMFFPARGEPTADARKVCASCPVQAECLELVLSMGDNTPGIWADTAERQRRRMRRAAKAAA